MVQSMSSSLKWTSLGEQRPRGGLGAGGRSPERPGPDGHAGDAPDRPESGRATLSTSPLSGPTKTPPIISLRREVPRNQSRRACEVPITAN